MGREWSQEASRPSERTVRTQWVLVTVLRFTGRTQWMNELNEFYMFRTKKKKKTIPYTPCMEYLPTFAPQNHPHIGKYTSTMEHMGIVISVDSLDSCSDFLEFCQEPRLGATGLALIRNVRTRFNSIIPLSNWSRQNMRTTIPLFEVSHCFVSYSHWDDLSLEVGQIPIGI